MRILTVICSGVGSRDTCVSKNENNCLPKALLVTGLKASIQYGTGCNI